MEKKNVAILSGSINLSAIDKNKIIKGKDGNQYVNVTMLIQSESQYGNNIWITQSQTKEEREAKEKAISLGNGAVRWVGGEITVAERNEVTNAQQQPAREEVADLPF